MNINDWSAIQTAFDKLHKQAEKAQRALGAPGPPRVYIKLLADLEVRGRGRTQRRGGLAGGGHRRGRPQLSLPDN